MAPRYRFGDVLIDEESFRLSRAGEPLAIEPKALNLLIFLVQHQGRLVERRELLHAVWGDAFVTEHVLNRCIGQLRKVLGDDSKEPRFIETVPTLGYRFIATVETETLEVSQPVPSPIEPHEAPSGPPDEMESGRRATPDGVSSLGSSVRLPRLRWLLLALSLGLVAILCFWIGYRRLHADAPVRSLAVLPLEDLSSGVREEYFADGMTDELITELARIPGLRVVSRTSVMQDKGVRKSLGQLAQELNVDAVLEGSVVQSGGRVRITAQLIDARSDKHLWAQSFEGPSGDILSLQDRVAREVALETSSVLTPAARAGLTNAKHVNPEAHDAYLRGLYFIQRRDGDLAVSYFRKAIALEPEYGAANAGLAEALTTKTLVDGEHASALMPEAIAAAKRAIELEPYSGESYTALGAIETTYLWDWNGAEQNLRRGIELSPSSSDAESWFAVYLTSVGRPAEAVSAMQRAVALNPLSFWANRLLGSMLFYSRRYDEALVALKRASEIAPDRLQFVEGWYSSVYEMQGRFDDAFAADLKNDASELSPRDIESFRTAFKTGGWRAYQEARVKFMLPRSSNECEASELGVSYVRLGDSAEAIRWFNQDVERRCGLELFTLSSDPRLDPLRNDERFRVLLHRLNLPH